MGLKKFGILVILGGTIAAFLSNYDIKISISIRRKEEKGEEEKEEAPLQTEKENTGRKKEK